MAFSTVRRAGMVPRRPRVPGLFLGTSGRGHGFISAAALLLLSVCFVRPSVARGDAPALWAVVAVADGPQQASAAQVFADRVERMLIAEGVSVLAPDEELVRFAARHSSAPKVLSPEVLATLRAQVQKATRLLALNRLREALAATRELRELGPAAQDYLRRELSQAHELFDVCVVTARQIAEAGDQLEASRHMLRCAQTFPGLKPVPEYHSPEVRALYDEVLANVQTAHPAILLIRSAGQQPCMTRVNGISWGPAPAQVETAPVAVRVQLECGRTPGRLHSIVLRPGFNEIVIDPIFDRAIRSAGGRLQLVYDPPATFEMRRAPDALTLVRALEVDRLVLVVAGKAPAVHLVDGAGAVLERVALGAGVFRDVGPNQESTDQAQALARVRSALLGTNGAPTADVSAVDPGPDKEAAPGSASPLLDVPALPVLPPSRNLAWVSPLTIGLGYALSIGGSAFALTERAFVRRDGTVGAFDADHYDATGSLGLGFMIGGAAVATAGELLTLPETEGVSSAAWIIGGVGAITALCGAVFIVAENDCVAGDERLSCTRVYRDRLLGPLLLVQSVPLLAVPGTYLLSGLLSETASARLEVDSSGPRVAVQGTF